MIEFVRPHYFWGLLLFLPLLIIDWGGYYYRHRQRKVFADARMITRLCPEASVKRRLWQNFFFVLSMLSIIFALARPRVRNSAPVSGDGKLGIDVVFCVDVSNSMNAEDVPPNRLVFAKQIVGQCLNRLDGSRVALVIFAGGAYVRLPLTSDRAIAGELVQDLQTGLISHQGTNLSQALRLGMNALPEKTEAGRAVVLLTDGENHEEEPIEIAKELQGKDISLYTIAVGGIHGASIPDGNGSFLSDEKGELVQTKCNPQLCEELAQAGGGESFSGSSARDITISLMQALSKMPQANVADSTQKQYELFVWPALLSLLFLLIAESISMRKSRLFAGLKMFER